MGFETLLGNQRLKDNLTSSLSRGRASHFYLISGPEGSGKHTLARLLAAALMCQSGAKPCLGCADCRKVLSGLHPDFITVEDPEHKHVPVKIIRQVRHEMFIRPNEGARKIYFLPQSLGIEGQNALLKILEEPPSYGVFILLTENPESLLPTVRSRCVELKLLPLDETTLRQALQTEFPDADSDAIRAAISRSGGWLGQARQLLEEGTQLPPQTQDLLTAYANRDPYGLASVLVPMEKMKRDQLIPLLNQWIAILEGAMIHRSGMPAATPMARELTAGRSGPELLAAITDLQKAAEYAQGNVSPAAICGWLLWALR